MTRRLRALGLPLAVSLALAIFGAGPAAATQRAQFPVQGAGDRGTDVVALQHLLRARGHGLAVTGYFADDTRRALKAFQERVGLRSSGVADVPTWAALVPRLDPGAGGEAVLALKTQLNAKRRAGLSQASSFDGATRDAVRAFQRHMGLPATGVADANTWRYLIWHFERPDFGRAGLCNYNGGSPRADWGTAAAVAQLEAAAALFNRRAGGRIAVGDIGFEHGGPINLHQTHQDGLDIDIALVRRDGRQCSRPGISYLSRQYDRAATREMLSAIHDALGPRLKLIYFNDPQMIGAGLAQRYSNHDDHIHVRLCEPDHVRARYVC